MSEITENTEERRVGTRRMIDNLLAERQQMLVAFCELAGLEPYQPEKPVKGQIDAFCQLLMDYTAFGHFELNRRFSEGCERRESAREAIAVGYENIAAVTDEAVGFNDKYDSSSQPLDLGSLPHDLSRLGERLAQLFEAEDRVIRALLRDIDGV